MFDNIYFINYNVKANVRGVICVLIFVISSTFRAAA